jgi:hypothetical protein
LAQLFSCAREIKIDREDESSRIVCDSLSCTW